MFACIAFPILCLEWLQSYRVITACIDYDLKTCPDSLLSMECACLDILTRFLRFPLISRSVPVDRYS